MPKTFRGVLYNGKEIYYLRERNFKIELSKSKVQRLPYNQSPPNIILLSMGTT